MKNTHARVKKQDEKYGVKNTKWPEVCVFTVFCKVLSDHILPRMTNTHARVKNPDEKYGVKNTKWAEVYVFTVFCKSIYSLNLLYIIKGYRPCRRPLMVFYGRRRRNHETIAGGYGQLGDQCAVCEPFSAL